MGSAFDHSPSITVPSSSTNTGIVTWSGTGGKTFLDSTVLVVGNNITIPGTITFGGTQITSTAAELNLLDGVSGLVQGDFTKLAAVDATAAELNLLNGVSGLVQADLTKLAAIDASAAEINKLDGAGSNVTATNLDALTGGGATALHSHSGGALTPWTSDVDTDGYDLITNDSNEDINIIPHGTGKVGIKTNAPEAVLHVRDGDSGLAPASGTVAMFESSDAECYIQLTGASDATGGFRFGQAGGSATDMAIYMHPDQLDFRFDAAGSHPNNLKFRFTSAGRLAVNHYSPSYSLDVKGQAKVEHSGQDYPIFLRNTDSSAPYGLHIYFTNSSYSGTTHPFLNCKNEGQSGLDMAKILSDGDFQSRSNSYGSMSDERVKQDIIEATPALPELIKMKVKEYKFVWTPEKTERGIIAQEFIADGINIPSFISILEDTHINNQGQEETVDTYTASYNKLIPWLVQAVQELNAKIDALS